MCEIDPDRAWLGVLAQRNQGTFVAEKVEAVSLPSSSDIYLQARGMFLGPGGRAWYEKGSKRTVAAEKTTDAKRRKKKAAKGALPGSGTNAMKSLGRDRAGASRYSPEARSAKSKRRGQSSSAPVGRLSAQWGNHHKIAAELEKAQRLLCI